MENQSEKTSFNAKNFAASCLNNTKHGGTSTSFSQKTRIRQTTSPYSKAPSSNSNPSAITTPASFPAASTINGYSSAVSAPPIVPRLGSILINPIPPLGPKKISPP